MNEDQWIDCLSQLVWQSQKLSQAPNPTVARKAAQKCRKYARELYRVTFGQVPPHIEDAICELFPGKD